MYEARRGWNEYSCSERPCHCNKANDLECADVVNAVVSTLDAADVCAKLKTASKLAVNDRLIYLHGDTVIRRL
jgi:hypothetical protein